MSFSIRAGKQRRPVHSKPNCLYFDSKRLEILSNFDCTRFNHKKNYASPNSRESYVRMVKQLMSEGEEYY